MRHHRAGSALAEKPKHLYSTIGSTTGQQALPRWMSTGFFLGLSRPISKMRQEYTRLEIYKFEYISDFQEGKEASIFAHHL